MPGPADHDADRPGVPAADRPAPGGPAPEGSAVDGTVPDRDPGPPVTAPVDRTAGLTVLPRRGGHGWRRSASRAQAPDADEQAHGLGPTPVEPAARDLRASAAAWGEITGGPVPSAAVPEDPTPSPGAPSAAPVVPSAAPVVPSAAPVVPSSEHASARDDAVARDLLAAIGGVAEGLPPVVAGPALIAPSAVEPAGPAPGENAVHSPVEPAGSVAPSPVVPQQRAATGPEDLARMNSTRDTPRESIAQRHEASTLGDDGTMTFEPPTTVLLLHAVDGGSPASTTGTDASPAGPAVPSGAEPSSGVRPRAAAPAAPAFSSAPALPATSVPASEVPEPTPEPMPGPMPGQTSGPAAEKAPPPAAEFAQESAAEPASGPASGPATEPAAEPDGGEDPAAVSEPVARTAPVFTPRAEAEPVSPAPAPMPRDPALVASNAQRAALADAARRLAGATTRAEVLSTTAAAARQIVDGGQVAVVLRSLQGPEVAIDLSDTGLWGPDTLAAIIRLTEPLRGSVPADPLRPDGPTALLTSPLWSRGALVGALLLRRDGQHPYQARDEDALDRLGRMVGAALDGVQRPAATSAARDVDPVTGLFMPMRLKNDLIDVVAAGPGLVGASAFVMVRLLGLADVRAQDAGAADELFREIARVQSLVLRVGDVVYRVGFDDVAFVLPGTSLGEASAVVGKFAAAVDDVVRRSGRSGVRITVAAAGVPVNGEPEGMLAQVQSALRVEVEKAERALRERG